MEKIRIQDDLYNYVNGEWIENATIPNDRPVTGGFSDLDKSVEEILRKDFDSMLKENIFPDKYLENAIKLYKIALDTKKRNEDGIKPILKTLKQIEDLNDISTLNNHMSELIVRGIPLPIELSINPDMKDTSHYIIYIKGPQTILPDTTYYKEEMKDQKEAMLQMWKSNVTAIMASTGLNNDIQEQYINDCLAFDEVISTMVKSNEEWSEYTKMYNIITPKKVFAALSPLDLENALSSLNVRDIEKISIADKKFINEFQKLFNEENFNLYKHWAYINYLLANTEYLSENLRELGGAFMRALTGVSEMSKVERYAYKLISSTYSEPIGVYYGRKYFGEKSKKDITRIVNEIIKTYKYRIKNNDFLQAATKKKAISKLDKMAVKMGYPEKIDEVYEKYLIDEDESLFINMCNINKINTLHELSKLKKIVDREHFEMPGHMVNACYNPFSNDITFPAAILQPPFYSINQTRSENLGGIGAVIGHEISHAFDNNGAKFDEDGNLFNWWSKEDLREFNKKTTSMINEFKDIELPFGKVNSKLIVSENIADNGGMAVTLEIMSRMNKKSYVEYFTNWAKIWCMKAKPEYQQLLLNVDVHAPAILRANMQPRNFSEWYSTFHVNRKDKMYIRESKRIIIW